MAADLAKMIIFFIYNKNVRCGLFYVQTMYIVVENKENKQFLPSFRY